ncbi:hypothetical protein P4S72_13555 [Vibrio sp. PP-XX7]
MPVLTVFCVIGLFNAGYYAYPARDFLTDLALILGFGFTVSSVVTLNVIYDCRKQIMVSSWKRFLLGSLSIAAFLAEIALCVLGGMYIHANQ